MFRRLFWEGAMAFAMGALVMPPTVNASGFRFSGMLPADAGPESVALADFNHDGNLDLAEVSYLAPYVSVWMGTGKGSFGPQVRYPVGTQPFGVSTADLNLDGNLDLVVANELDDTISVLLGNGDGTFQPQLVFPAGDGPTATSVGDFNNDGWPDVVTDAVGAPLLLGNGDGTFESPRSLIAGGGLYSVSAGDVNRDHNLDVVLGQVAGLGSQGIAKILLGNGGGSFETAGNYSLMVSIPSSIAVGDLNHDHKLDLAVSLFSNGIAVLLGHGDGTFRRAVFYGTPDATYGIVMADFNRDGNPDVATSLFNQPSFVSVFNGNGDGTLRPAVSYNARGGEAKGIAAGDLNGDGSPDIVVATGEMVSILLNTGGTFLKTTSSLNPSHLGDSVTFTTKVKQSVPGTGVPTGTVTFKDGSTALGTVPLNSGVATFTTSALSVGSHKVVATYSGDVNFNPNDAKAFTQVVDP